MQEEYDVTSIVDYDTTVLTDEPLDPAAAKALIASILRTGSVTPSQHALEQLKARAMTMVDVVNILRAGVVEPGEFLNGTWRYRVRTPRMNVVIAFRSETELRVVTAWRGGR